jgi:RNA polymerase sigma-70 factor (ECF subfamily)
MLGRVRHDRLFARFVADGDVHALGEVFDATAPELMRIATHLVGSREQARDLVQSAFLIAMEKRAEFAVARRVLPWLCGIVANLARNERRRAKRELAALPRTCVEDPGAAAEASEFRAAFARAKAALPEVYRPVIELHLEHGLNAAEVGGALGRPKGTVRTQIVRGLELLRRRLPRGFVAGLAAAPVSAEALRETRAFVLGSAAEVAPAPGGAAVAAGRFTLSVMGAGAVNKQLAVFGAVGLILVGLGLWLAGASPGRSGDAPERPSAPASTSAGAGDARDRDPAAMSRPTAEREVDTPPGSAPPGGSLVVIARWKLDETPARAQAIDVVYADEVLGELRPRRVVTDGEGRAVFETLRPGAILVQSSTGVRQPAEVVAGVRGTVTLALDGLPVHGQVLDHCGDPVADADVWVSSELRYVRVRTGDRPGHGQYGQRTLRTDARGRFETRMASLQCLAAFKEGHGPSPTVYPLRGLGALPERPVSVVLRLEAEGGGLAVTVRGRQATPVGEALVLAGPEIPHFTGEDDLATTPALRALTNEAGLARLSPLRAARIPVEVRAAGYGPWCGEVEIPAGGVAGLEVLLVEGAVVTGFVFDAHGAPLADVLVRHGAEAALRTSLATTDARGAYRLENLPAGEVTLVVFHEGWGSVSQKLTLAAGGTQRWDARMPARAAITGLVLDSDGLAAGGSCVYGYAPGSSLSATAGATGRFLLSPVHPGQVYEIRAEVRVRGGGYGIARRSAVPAGAEIELRPSADEPPAGRLRGRVLHSDGKPAKGHELRASPLDGSPGTMLAIGADGTFELGPWQPTRLRLAVHRPPSSRALADFGVHEMRAGATVDLGDLVLPTAGAVRIRITGGEAEQGVATLFRDGVHVDARRVTKGTVAWDELQPGAYAVCVVRAGARPLAGSAEFEVYPGRVAELAVAMSGANRHELRFATPNGCPAGPVILRATDRTGRTVMIDWILIERDDAPAQVVLPIGASELYVASDDGYRGRVNVSGAGTEPIVVTFAREK